MGNIVAIVGRPNVGKSTLFNRLIGQRKAIVDDVSGVTRDRHYGVSDWNGKDFIVIDTGGYVAYSEDFFEKAIRRQVEIAVEEADVLIFLVDITTGITDEDDAFAKVLRKSKKPVLVVTNKVDNYERLADLPEFYKMGFKEIFPVSSMTGSGTGELLDRVVELIQPDYSSSSNTKAQKDIANADETEVTDKDYFDIEKASKFLENDNLIDTEDLYNENIELDLDKIYEAEENEEEEDAEEEEVNIPKFTIVGRPNVGKSTLVNALLGEERSIVSEIAGTTRDSIHTHYNKFGMEFLLIDTAGIRKKGKVHEDIEFYSVMRAIRALEECDVCFLVIDAQTGMETQDQKLFHLAQVRKKGIVILVNKWDIVEKDTHTANSYIENIKSKIAPLTDVPILTISALEKQRIHKALETGMQVYKNRSKRIPTRKLNEMLQQITGQTPPPIVKDKMVRIKYVTQLPTKTPIFAFFANHPQYIRDSYKRFLENQLRKRYDFTGVPISLVFRKK